MNLEQIQSLISKFYIPQQVVSFKEFGNGHINDTYLVVVKDGSIRRRFIFQRINTDIFLDIDGTMNNIFAVTEYLRYKFRILGKDPDSHTLTVVKTKEGGNYYRDENGYCYRCMPFIDNAASLTQAETPSQMYLCGRAFGEFQRHMTGFDASVLVETIPNFHNTVDRLAKLRAAVEQDKAGRVSECQAEIEFFLSRERYASMVLDRIAAGRIPLRVTHNDTKLDNVLLDLTNNEPMAVIDLDTVMPGSILYDFGDAIRGGAGTAAEDEPDLSKVHFSMEMYKAFAEGFVGTVKNRLSLREVKYMHFGAILMTYECGMRFLTDYLNGDTYFKVSRPGQNLDRTHTHMRMVEEMELCEKQMQKIVIDIVFEMGEYQKV